VLDRVARRRNALIVDATAISLLSQTEYAISIHADASSSGDLRPSRLLPYQQHPKTSLLYLPS